MEKVTGSSPVGSTIAQLILHQVIIMRIGSWPAAVLGPGGESMKRVAGWMRGDCSTL